MNLGNDRWGLKYANNFWIARLVILMHWHEVDFIANLGYGKYYTVLDDDLINHYKKKVRRMTYNDRLCYLHRNAEYWDGRINIAMNRIRVPQ
jgi:hypothetical protein